jgi:cell division protein ZapA (FtsZ GTPase activity inhibitor)
MDEHLTEVKLLGVSFTIRSEEDPSYLNDVMNYFKQRVEETTAQIAMTDPLKVSIVAAINIVDELFKERISSEKHAEKVQQAEDITNRLKTKIDDALDSLITKLPKT